MTAAILSAINILTKPLAASAHDAQSSPQAALLASLGANRALLRERLQADGSLEEVSRLREEAKAAAAWFNGDTEDGTWGFVQECLLLLLTLVRHLSAELELFQRRPAPPAARQRTPEMAPRLPPDVLSVGQQQTLGAALQFVVSLGLCPYLASGVGVSLGRRSAFGAAVDQLVRGAAVPAAGRRLLTTTSVLLQSAELSSLATLVFTRHLGDVLAALCQLGYQPRRAESSGTEEGKELSAEECQTCKEALKSLLGKVYQPMIIKELLILQGGPKQSGAGGRAASSRASAPSWLKRLCGRLLSERLMQPHGVQAVVRAVLEGGTGGESDWRKCDGVARILGTCPQQSASADAYYTHVCHQILDLLHFKDKLTALQHQRVATRAVLFIVQEKPGVARQLLLTPLLAPLHRCSAASNEGHVQVAVEEWELTRCVDDVYKIWVVGNSPSPPLLAALEQVLPVIFSLFCFTKQNVSHLRAPCQEVLLWYLRHAETGLSALRRLSGLQGHKNEVAEDFRFTPGSDGGARLSSRERCSEKDDALYEKLAGEQWRLDCLMQLLAELKDCDLPGDFFLDLLQELASWAAAAEEAQEDEAELSGSSVTLLEAERRRLAAAARRGHGLAVLQVLAVTVDCLQPTVLLRKTSQVVDFLLSMLQRACVGLDQTPGPHLGNPVESETLRMGMGVVATLLSGPEITVEDYSSMSRLLPSLESLSQKHADVVVQQLAADLRALIATHGAYRPENATAAAPPTRDPETTAKNNAVSMQTKANASPSSPQASLPDSRSPSGVSPKGGGRTSGASIRDPPTSNRDPPTSIRDPPTSNRDPPASNRDPPTSNRGPPTSNRGPPTSNRDPPTSNRDPSTSNRGPPTSNRGPPTSNRDPPAKPLSDWLLEACDPDVPTRAFALRTLTKMVQNKTPEAVQAQEKVLMLFLENLEHEDSFVYLSAIQGLSALADSYPERILGRLLGDFQHGPSLPTSSREHALETRLKVGEVLMRASRAMGELAAHLGRPLIVVFLRGTRDPDQSVRASSLSNLGELCQRLDHSLGPLAQELSSCLTALIKTEREAEVRRAAVHVITLLLRGLGDKTTQVLGDVLLDLYRALKWAVRSDPDDVVVLHAQLALEEIDDVMRRFIFPEQKLEKKIVVLP